MKKNRPLFSIVVPTLNEEDYLGILLESLSKQSYALYHTFFKGPIYSKLFDYPMGGGHYYHEKQKKI